MVPVPKGLSSEVQAIEVASLLVIVQVLPSIFTENSESSSLRNLKLPDSNP
jgi:hypothetical protein